MKVKVTKTMTKFLQQQLKSEKLLITHEKLNQNYYRVYVDYNLIDHIDDYNYDTQLFSVIRINYPAECYALCRYLTTRDLNRIFIRSDRSAAGFIAAVKDEILI